MSRPQAALGLLGSTLRPCSILRPPPHSQADPRHVPPTQHARPRWPSQSTRAATSTARRCQVQAVAEAGSEIFKITLPSLPRPINAVTSLSSPIAAHSPSSQDPAKPLHRSSRKNLRPRARQDGKRERNNTSIKRNTTSTSPAPASPSSLTAQQQENMRLLDCYYATDLHSKRSDSRGRSVWVSHIPQPPNSFPYSKQDATSAMRIAQELVDLLEKNDTSNETLYAKYAALPRPGVQWLRGRWRFELLRRLSVVQRRPNKVIGAKRFYLVFEDMQAAGFNLSPGIWSSAIHFAGRSPTRTTSPEVDEAMRTWGKMELSGITADHSVTFNILFDVAVKGGHFRLADLILAEMKARNIAPKRHTYVGLIHYAGLKSDNDGIRRAYYGMIEAGEVIDTVVLNAVISALIHADEPHAAEMVFARMKDAQMRSTGQFGIRALSWRTTRQLDRELSRLGAPTPPDALQEISTPDHISDVEAEPALSESAALLIGPDTRTYSILVEYHASQTGNLPRVAQLLHELQMARMPLQGRVFLELFRGFALHHDTHLSPWTRSRLECVWSRLLAALEEQAPHVRLQRPLVMWIVRAFRRCRGRNDAWARWHLLKPWWSGNEDQKEAIVACLEAPDHQI